MKRILFLTLILGMIGTSSCKKDKDCSLDSSSITGTYKVIHSYYKANSTTAEVDEFTSWDACEKDDLIKIIAGGALTLQDAGVACTPAGDESGTWSLIGNTITITWAGSTPETESISSFSCSGMTVQEDLPNGGYTKTVLQKL